ncbi:MAG: DUF2079 domain-containing protein [Ktedonobacteraceae bacterium]|nr:DUF2079 domain-containing protein [Ktedonobacteraceae bacterium]
MSPSSHEPTTAPGQRQERAWFSAFLGGRSHLRRAHEGDERLVPSSSAPMAMIPTRGQAEDRACEEAVPGGKPSWRVTLSRWSARWSYPAPEPLSWTCGSWMAMGIVIVAVLAFCGFFVWYLLVRHDALLTGAEDLGIMDQVLWSTLHGSPLHQTICNTLSDTNCVGPDGIMRFAIHVEPILFPLSLLYAVVPSPKTLIVLQTLVVASGAFPAFWLALLRLRHDWAAAGVALLYLLYPGQQQATVFDFHAVTLTAALLLFVLYCLYTRRTGWTFVCALLAMACKEEIGLVVATFGVWSMLLQRRWRSGGALTALGLLWTVIVLWYVIPAASPTGHALLLGRYQQLGDGPLQILITILTHPLDTLRDDVLEPAHLFYLRVLPSPAAYVPLLAPWALTLALPSLALNLLSSYPNMYSGFYQYNAEIVPVLLFATIEGLVVMRWGAKRVLSRGRLLWRQRCRRLPASRRRRKPLLRAGGVDLLRRSLLLLLMGFILLYALRTHYRGYATLPLAPGFHWPVATTHTQLASQFLQLIPATASVSAQTNLVPHLSQRAQIYLFPYEDEHASYLLLDGTGSIYPFLNWADYAVEIKKIWASGKYGIVMAQDGYILLQAGLPPPSFLPNWIEGG